MTSALSQSKNSGTAKVPVSYGIAVDNSGSARASLDKIIETINAIVDANEEIDETFFVRFTSSDKISLIEEFTKDKSKIRDEANDLFIDRGTTAILDAIEFSAKYLSENSIKEAGRNKVIILITDGEEKGSVIKLEDSLKSLNEKGIKVFALGISDEPVSKKILGKLTSGTSGKLFLPKNQLELTSATNELINIIRNQ